MRKITSLSLLLSFIVISYTGIILFICPYGRVAYWSDWKILGMTKGQYGDLHITSMITFLIFAFLHIYYNWRPLMHYLKDKSKKFSFTKKEVLIALLIHVFLIGGTLYKVQPFTGFMQMGSSIRKSWGKGGDNPPYGHAQRTKMNVLCIKMNINVMKAVQNFKDEKIIFELEDTVRVIADKNSTSPAAIYKVMTKNNLP